MSKKHTCEFCNKEYSKLANLKYHQKTAKFCIDLQQIVLQKEELFTCKFCNKDFTVKHNFSAHIQTCKEQIPYYKKKAEEYEKKYKDEIKEYKIKHEYNQKEIERLQKEIEEYKKLIARPTTVYNNTTNNNNTQNNYNVQFKKMVSELTPFTDKNIKESIKNFPEDFIENINDPNNDVYDFFATCFTKALKDLYFCSDVSRQVLVVKNEDGKSDKMQAKDFASKCMNTASDEIDEFIITKSEDYIIDQAQNDNLLISGKEAGNKLDNIRNVCKKDSTKEEEDAIIKKTSTRLSKSSKSLYKHRIK